MRGETPLGFKQSIVIIGILSTLLSKNQSWFPLRLAERRYFSNRLVSLNRSRSAAELRREDSLVSLPAFEYIYPRDLYNAAT